MDLANEIKCSENTNLSTILAKFFALILEKTVKSRTYGTKLPIWTNDLLSWRFIRPGTQILFLKNTKKSQ